jgi:hypothetical protein
MAKTAAHFFPLMRPDLPSFSFFTARHNFLTFVRQKSQLQNSKSQIIWDLVLFGFWI